MKVRFRLLELILGIFEAIIQKVKVKFRFLELNR